MDLSVFRFATAEATVLPLSRARVLFDGMFTEPRLQHPEGVAVGPDGAVWCGSENGQILRIDPRGGGIEEVASTGGFVLDVEFTATRIMPKTNVGGYENTGWDLVSNLVGSTLAAGWLWRRPNIAKSK